MNLKYGSLLHELKLIKKNTFKGTELPTSLPFSNPRHSISVFDDDTPDRLDGLTVKTHKAKLITFVIPVR